MKKTVLSCIQPTGEIHYGNYFGAVKNWVKLQEDFDCIYGIVDYHAMTMPYNVKKLRNQTWDLIFNLLAVGIKKESLFIQSLVPEHAELSWIFNCFCPAGRLAQMTQYKDKSGDQKGDQFISAGLLDYPVLQAADILIYKADYVPVGKDQDQHLELTRTIAQRFNNQVGREYFVLPETLHSDTPKIKSTADPSKKMSKSAGEKHNIKVFESSERIRKQIRSAVTDTGSPSGQMSDGVANLFELLKASDAMYLHDQLMSAYADGSLKYADLKHEVAEVLVGQSEKFNKALSEILADKKQVKNEIKQSSSDIRRKAQQTVREVKELVGLLNVKA